MTATKKFDLEDRTLQFGKDVVFLCRTIRKDLVTKELVSQVVRSACSVGANYIEANEALSKKDFIHRIKIARKEAKETVFWLKIIKEEFSENKELETLIDEAVQLKKILSSIIEKSV